MTPKTKRMLEVEERFNGEPLEKLIPRLFRELGQTQLVAHALGQSRNTLRIWRVCLGIVTTRATAIVENGANDPSTVGSEPPLQKVS